MGTIITPQRGMTAWLTKWLGKSTKATRVTTAMTATLLLSVTLAACGAAPASDSAPSAANAGPTQEAGTVIAATLSVPTSAPAVSTGQSLPAGTLVVFQNNQPIALTPNGSSIALSDDRFGSQGSPDGRYGVSFVINGNAVDLALVDYTAAAQQVKEIPNGKGLSAPTLTWKDDSSGFAFFDFPSPDRIATSNRSLFYFDITSGQTRELIKAPSGSVIPAAKAFSPDGNSLIYTQVDALADLGSSALPPVFLLNVASGAATALPPQVGLSFNQWLKDSSGFVTIQQGDGTAPQVVQVWRLNALNAPQTVTPSGYSDRLLDLSPDGKRIVVSSDTVGVALTATNLFIMNLDGSSRRPITTYTDSQQTIGAVIWGADGIYFTLYGADNAQVTNRVDLDGNNLKKAAEGSLFGIIGVR
jgi:hypothetical protein